MPASSALCCALLRWPALAARESRRDLEVLALLGGDNPAAVRYTPENRYASTEVWAGYLCAHV